MLGTTPVEMGVVALLAGVGSLLPLFVVYWVIRLGVRHGVMDARTRAPREPGIDS